MYDPCHEDIDNALLPLRADWNAARHFPPLLKTRPATTGTSVLCDENGMASHWRLLPVVLRIGRCQPHANEILAMTAYRIQALFRYVLPVRSRKAKAASKLRSAESQKCRIKCSLVRHGRRYTFSTNRLISSITLSLCGIAISFSCVFCRFNLLCQQRPPFLPYRFRVSGGEARVV